MENPPQFPEGTFDVVLAWEILSYAWSEIGIEDGERLALVREAGLQPAHLGQIDRLYFRDVCSSFAVESFLVLPCMLWMILPDWGFSREYLEKRVHAWYRRPLWRHFLNPLRVLGYPSAIFLSLVGWWKLRQAIRANAQAIG